MEKNLKSYFKLKGKKDLTKRQAVLFGIKMNSPGWKKKNLLKTVSDDVWEELLKCMFVQKPEEGFVKLQDLYLLEDSYGKYKIGISKDPFSRANFLKNASGSEVKVVAIWDTKLIKARQVETDLHRRYYHLRLEGEWFDLGKDAFKRITAYLKDTNRFDVELKYSSISG
jgi:hypothetical protein